MYNEEYYNKVLKRGFIAREDLDGEERKGVLDTTLLKLKDGIPECLKYTFNIVFNNCFSFVYWVIHIYSCLRLM